MKNLNGRTFYEKGDKFKILRPIFIARVPYEIGSIAVVGDGLTAEEAGYLERIGKMEYTTKEPKASTKSHV